MLTLTSYCQPVSSSHHCKHHSQQLQSSPSTSDDLEGEEVDMDAIVMKTTIQMVVAFIFIADTSSYTPHFALFETLSERERVVVVRNQLRPYHWGFPLLLHSILQHLTSYQSISTTVKSDHYS